MKTIISEHIDYSRTGKFSTLADAYLQQDVRLNGLYKWPFSKDGLRASAAARKFDPAIREDLVAVLRVQYHGMKVDPAVTNNLNALAEPDTITVTTGHQLCLLTGPLFFPIKVLNAIRVANELNEDQDRKVVPILWLASEDHDRAEIDHAFIHGIKLEWPGAAGGAVGRMELEGMDVVLEAAEQALGQGDDAAELMRIFSKAYQDGYDLSRATRILVNELFGSFGLLVLDADDVRLKKHFIDVMQREIKEGITKQHVSTANGSLEKHFNVQAHVRDINLFHLGEGRRDRILKEGEEFVIDGKGTRMDARTMLQEIKEHPESFSPNVLMRPLYQETILPNVAYIGGGGELAYWLQLKPLFDHCQLAMPQLIMRTSTMLIGAKEAKRMDQLGLTVEQLFSPIHELQRQVAENAADSEVSMENELGVIAKLFEGLADRAAAIDPTLERSIKASEARTKNELERAEKRMVRALKRKHSDHLDRLQELMDVLMPSGVLQERRENFSGIYATIGPELFEILLQHLDPFQKRFTIIKV